jgi:hypothetical protein
VISRLPYAAPPLHNEDPFPAELAQPQQVASLTPVRSAGVSACEASTPSTEALLSKAFSATGHGASSLPPSGAGPRSHPIAELTSAGAAAGAAFSQAGAAAPRSSVVASSAAHAHAAQLVAGVGSVGAAADMAASSAPKSSRSRPDLQEAIEAALRRSTAPQSSAAPAAPAFTHLPAAPAQPAPSIMLAAAPSSVQLEPPVTAGARLSHSVVQVATQPAAASAQPRHAAVEPAAGPQPAAVPMLRLVSEQVGADNERRDDVNRGLGTSGPSLQFAEPCVPAPPAIWASVRSVLALGLDAYGMWPTSQRTRHLYDFLVHCVFSGV